MTKRSKGAGNKVKEIASILTVPHLLKLQCIEYTLYFYLANSFFSSVNSRIHVYQTVATLAAMVY